MVDMVDITKPMITLSAMKSAQRLLIFSSLLSASLIACTSGFAQDRVYVKGTETTGTITKVDDLSVFIQTTGDGTLALQRGAIERVEIKKPATLASALKALEERKFTEAIQTLEPLHVKYRGLPEPWLEDATLKLGEAYLGTKDWVKARGIFAFFKKYYPKSPLLDIVVSNEAQALFSTQSLPEAAKLLEGMVSKHEKEVSVSDEQNRALGKAFVILGHCYLAGNKNEEALTAFLKTTTLYYMDAGAVAEAQYHSALLFEKMNQVSRARGQLEELIKESPNSPLAEEARKKLIALPANNKT
jgi:predicted Zn-dependent protease